MNPKIVGAAAFFCAAVMVVAQTSGTATSGAKRANEQAESLSRIKQLSTGMMIYLADSDDIYPYPQATKAWQFALYPYLKNKQIYLSTNPSKPGPFQFNMNLGGVFSADVPDAKTPLFYDPTAWPDGKRMYSCADSSATVVSPTDWAKAAKLMKTKIQRKAKKPLPANYGSSFKL